MMGGRAKQGSNFTELVPYLDINTSIIAFGESAETIRQQLQANFSIKCYNKLAEAVEANIPSYQNVLFSPACESFDQYHNFEERGDHFMALVKKRLIDD
jgi:UDP-N-acetylmuramoylalanine--D-glutamate ligase